MGGIAQQPTISSHGNAISVCFGLAGLFFAETKILKRSLEIRFEPHCFSEIRTGLRVEPTIAQKHTKLEKNFWTIRQQASSCLYFAQCLIGVAEVRE